MEIIDNLPDSREHRSPVVLTIGTFDGIHLGHQEILANMQEIAKQKRAKTALITFANHPSTILKPNNPTPLLCSLDHRIYLLESMGLDLLIILPFTRELSEQSASTFLDRVLHALPFSILILGSDATIGKEKEGNRQLITKLSKTMNFETVYLPDMSFEGERISSSKIRKLVQSGQLQQVEKLLGRRYSIYAPITSGSGRGANIGFPTANLAVAELALPPLGVYAVSLLCKGKEFAGVANLGIAPTVREKSPPILEVHIFDQQLDLYGEHAEVFFHAYLRPEQRFANLEELQKQIAEDILSAKEIHRQLKDASSLSKKILCL